MTRMSPAIARRAMKLLSGSEKQLKPIDSLEDYKLSSREIEILKEIVEGNTSANISEKLF